MRRVVILSAGSVAADVAARVQAEADDVEIVVADRDLDKARAVVADLGLRPEQAAYLDAADPASIREVIAGAELVFNGIGPYYRFGIATAREAVAAGAHYIDICDEYDVAHALVTDADLDREAKAKGLIVLTGMGSSPGLSNLLGRWAVDSLDETDSVEFVLGLPFHVDLGRTINAHMLHSLTGTVIQWLDGEYVEVPAWSDPQGFDLLGRGGRHEFAYWGHPEAITLPRFVEVKTATSRFSWFQPEGNEIYRTLDRWGFGDDRRPDGLEVSALEFVAAHMGSAGGRQGMSLPVNGVPMVNVWHIVATGTLDGAPTQVTFEAELDLLTRGRVHGAGLTGLPAAAGVLSVLRGEVSVRGVLGPEACFDPERFVPPVYEQMGVRLTRRTSRIEQLIGVGEK